MRIGLFAGKKVGLEIAAFFGKTNEPLACLVVDANDKSGINEQIIHFSGIDRDSVFSSDSLTESNTLARLNSLSIDLFILAWWPYIIKEPLIELPRIGILNFHPSYLPFNRGKHYNFWNLVEETPFGVTLHFVDSGVDTGDIAFQSRIEKSWEDSGGSLYHKAQEEIVRLFIEKFPSIKAGEIPRIPQDHRQGSFHRGRELEPASEIQLDRSYRARELLNLLRARTFSPHPGAWFIDQGVKYRVRIEIKRDDSESVV